MQRGSHFKGCRLKGLSFSSPNYVNDSMVLRVFQKIKFSKYPKSYSIFDIK